MEVTFSEDARRDMDDVVSQANQLQGTRDGGAGRGGRRTVLGIVPRGRDIVVGTDHHGASEQAGHQGYEGPQSDTSH